MRRSTTFLMCLSALVMVSACSRPAGNGAGGGTMAPSPDTSAPSAAPEQNPPATTPPPAAPDQAPPATPPTDQSGEASSSEKSKSDDTTPH